MCECTSDDSFLVIADEDEIEGILHSAFRQRFCKLRTAGFVPGAP